MICYAYVITCINVIANSFGRFAIISVTIFGLKCYKLFFNQLNKDERLFFQALYLALTCEAVHFAINDCLDDANLPR